MAVAVRPVLRALRHLLSSKPPEPTIMELPAIDEDGDPCWVQCYHAPTYAEQMWATSPSVRHREAYHVYAVTKAREQAEADGFVMGWL